MDYQEYINLGLEGAAPLKVIMCGNVQESADGKVGVVSIVYATLNKDAARQKIQELAQASPNDYYMVYSVPLDTDLTTLSHYPSIAISKSDL